MKKKNRNRPHHSKGTPGSTYRPLTESESNSMQEDIKRDFRESKVFGQNDPILVNNLEEKMSEVLIDFARPFLDKYGSEIGMIEKIISLSIVGWNLAIVPPSEKRVLIADALRTIPTSQRQTAEDVLKLMEERKRKYFNGINRYIVNYKFKECADSFNIVVASTPSKDQMVEIRKNSGKLTSVNLVEKKHTGTNPYDFKPAILESSILRLMLSKLKECWASSIKK